MRTRLQKICGLCAALIVAASSITAAGGPAWACAVVGVLTGLAWPQ